MTTAPAAPAAPAERQSTEQPSRFREWLLDGAAPREADGKSDAEQSNEPVQGRQEWLPVSQRYEKREQTRNHEAH